MTIFRLYFSVFTEKKKKKKKKKKKTTTIKE